MQYMSIFTSHSKMYRAVQYTCMLQILCIKLEDFFPDQNNFSPVLAENANAFFVHHTAAAVQWVGKNQKYSLLKLVLVAFSQVFAYFCFCNSLPKCTHQHSYDQPPSTILHWFYVDILSCWGNFVVTPEYLCDYSRVTVWLLCRISAAIST